MADTKLKLCPFCGSSSAATALTRRTADWQPVETAPADGTFFIGARIGADGLPYACLATKIADSIYVLNPNSDFYKPLDYWIPTPRLPRGGLIRK